MLIGSEDALIDRGRTEELLEGRREDSDAGSLLRHVLPRGMTSPIDEDVALRGKSPISSTHPTPHLRE